jgi:hypothetical protein
VHAGTSTAPAPKPVVKPTTPPLSAAQQNVFDLIAGQLSAWGLTTLNADLKSLIIGGDTSPDTLTLALSNTAAYKARFAGNDIRIKNGLAALTPAQYVATETQYSDILRSYGLPAGFYDKQSDFTDFIGKDISAAELDSRAKIAHDQYEAAPDATKALWTQYYGTKGDAIAGILDPTVATQVIQDRSTQVAIGGAAAQQGLSVNQSRAQQLQQAGVTGQQAQSGYQQIAKAMPFDNSIAQRFGTTFGLQQEENSVLLGNAADDRQRQTLYAEETSLFKAHGGATKDSLGVGQEV